MKKLVKESLFEISLEGSNLERMGLGYRNNIKRWLEEMGFENFTYTINDDLFINVTANVNLNERLSEHRLPPFIKFKEVYGNFWCYGNELTSLEGCPNTVRGSFSCHRNSLTSLKGCPNTVKEGFYCYSNELVSLEGCPDTLNNDFYCYNNELVSLEGCPNTVNGDFWCFNNKRTFTEEEVRAICKVKGKIKV